MDDRQLCKRREFISGAAALGAFAALPRAVAVPPEGRPLKFLFMTDHHIESYFMDGCSPVYSMWRAGNHRALVETYKFINEDPYCRDADFALFGGDQIDKGYTRTKVDMAAQMSNYHRTLDMLDLHAKTKGKTADMCFTAAPWVVRQNLGRGDSAYEVRPRRPCSRVIAIQGNHDTGVDEFYRDCAFTAGDTRFVTFFASYVGLPAPKGQYRSTGKIADATVEFVEGEMSAAASDPRIRHIVLVCHWSIVLGDDNFKWPIMDACKENGGSDNRRKLLDIARKYGCDLFINGHEHNGGYPVGKAGTMGVINCGSVTSSPPRPDAVHGSNGAFAVVEMHPDMAVFNVYSRADVREDGGTTVVAQRPRRLFVREIPLKPLR